MTPEAPESLRDRFRGALVGTAVGDALGAPFEGLARVPSAHIESLQRDPHELVFTDDTAMTIGVARSLVDCGSFDGPHMAARVQSTLSPRRCLANPAIAAPRFLRAAASVMPQRLASSPAR